MKVQRWKCECGIVDDGERWDEPPEHWQLLPLAKGGPQVMCVTCRQMDFIGCVQRCSVCGKMAKPGMVLPYAETGRRLVCDTSGSCWEKAEEGKDRPTATEAMALERRATKNCRLCKAWRQAAPGGDGIDRCSATGNPASARSSCDRFQAKEPDEDIWPKDTEGGWSEDKTPAAGDPVEIEEEKPDGKAIRDEELLAELMDEDTEPEALDKDMVTAEITGVTSQPRVCQFCRHWYVRPDSESQGDCAFDMSSGGRDSGFTCEKWKEADKPEVDGEMVALAVADDDTPANRCCNCQWWGMTIFHKLPGVGPLPAAMNLCKLRTIGRIDHPDGQVSYTGPDHGCSRFRGKPIQIMCSRCGQDAVHLLPDSLCQECHDKASDVKPPNMVTKIVQQARQGDPGVCPDCGCEVKGAPAGAVVRCKECDDAASPGVK